jgi:hypothetical protein
MLVARVPVDDLAGVEARLSERGFTVDKTGSGADDGLERADEAEAEAVERAQAVSGQAPLLWVGGDGSFQLTEAGEAEPEAPPGGYLLLVLIVPLSGD